MLRTENRPRRIQRRRNYQGSGIEEISKYEFQVYSGIDDMAACFKDCHQLKTARGVYQNHTDFSGSGIGPNRHAHHPKTLQPHQLHHRGTQHPTGKKSELPQLPQPLALPTPGPRFSCNPEEIMCHPNLLEELAGRAKRKEEPEKSGEIPPAKWKSKGNKEILWN